MSHVDEGALHAYLDGALDEYPATEAARIREHLDGCAECARRLEDERAIRSQAHGILALAAPEVEAPSFEELRAYVRRTRPGGGGASTRALRMRWAASVVLALGTGWLLRGGIPGPAADAALEAPRSIAADDEIAGAAEPSARQESAPTVTAARRAAEADGALGRAAAPGELPAAAAEAREDEVARAEAPQLAERLSFTDVRADQTAPSAVDAPEANVAVAAAGAISADQVGSGAGRGIPLEPDPPAAARKVEPTDRVASGPAVTALADAPATGARDAVAPDADAVADSASPTAEPAGDESRARTALPAVAALERGGATSLRAMAPEEQEGEPAPPTVRLTVPGYAVVSITNLGQGTAYYGVQAVQRLEAGSTFEIYHLEPGVERSVVPAPAEGVGEVERLTADGWVVLQGPLPTNELEALLARLLPDEGGSEG